MPPNRITVVTVDDHPLLREGIASVLRTLPDVELIGEAANGREALALVLERSPDITLMDIQMPVMNGIATQQGRALRVVR